MAKKDIVEVGKWKKFRAEIFDSTCHFYLGDMETPQITFNCFSYTSGSVGFKPRFSGAECWIDSVSVHRISALSYKGKSIPDIEYTDKDSMITSWNICGPFFYKQPLLEEGTIVTDESAGIRWDTISADYRGCFVISELSERYSGKRILYAYKRINSSQDQKATLHFSTTNPIFVWINKEYIGPVKPTRMAWFDFLSNEEHAGSAISFDLKRGENTILLKIQGGLYGGDGFYSSLELN